MTNQAATAALRDEIAAAKARLLQVAGEFKGEWIRAQELRNRARNGWDAAVMSFAFHDLVDEGKLEANRDEVRLAG